MSGTLRVALIEPVGGHGGMHHYDVGLAGGLTAAGAAVSLYTSSVRELELPVDSRLVLAFRGAYGKKPRPLRALLYLVALERTLRSVRHEDAGVLHLHAFGGTRIERFTLSRARTVGRPVVLTVHDIRSLGDADTHDGLADYYRRPDALVVHNRSSRHAVTALAPDLLPEEIPHGHYLDTYGEPPSRRQARQRIGIDDEPFLLLFFGQIKPSKGLDVLLRALPAVRARHPGIRLLIAGRAWRDRPERYRSLVRELGLESTVEFRLGFVDDAVVPALVAAANLVVLPYQRIYQSGVALLAMSLGRAVLASDLPALREIVRDDRTGFLFRRGDVEHLAERVSDLIERREDLDATGRAARDWVERHHDWRAIGRRTLALYRSLLDREGS